MRAIKRYLNIIESSLKAPEGYELAIHYRLNFLRFFFKMSFANCLRSESLLSIHALMA